MGRASILELIAALSIISCTTSVTSDSDTQSEMVERGKLKFSEDCSGCHDFLRNGIGPQLGGVTEHVSSRWIKDFIRDPSALLRSGDARSQMLFARFNVIMPSFAHYSEAELDAIVAYLQTKRAVILPDADPGGLKPLDDPIPATIARSGLEIPVELVAQVPASSNTEIMTRIDKFSFIPGTERNLVLDMRGKLYELRNGGVEVYLDIAELKGEFIHKPGLGTGFGSFAFHPNFLENGLLYTTHSERTGSIPADFASGNSTPVAMQWIISEWQADEPWALPFAGRSRELLRINVAGGHGMTEIAFDPIARSADETYGLLYIGVGDGTLVQQGYPSFVGTIETPAGSILRIDPLGKNSSNGRYGIPPSNPFVDRESPDVVKEIYAYGFRNPHRISWTKFGQMLATNIGQRNIESINLIRPGQHYGWPHREGAFLINPHGNLDNVYLPPADDYPSRFSYPIAQYDHDEGAAIIGGYEYTGTLVPELRGKYLFADMNNGRLFYLDLREINLERNGIIHEWTITRAGRSTTTSELCGHERVHLRLGQDNHGEIYLFSKQDGKIYRLSRTLAKSRAISPGHGPLPGSQQIADSHLVDR